MVVSRCLLLLPLLTLLGVSTVQGLQKGLEYLYRYEGWAGTGIKEISNKGAVSAIRADLFIQILDTNETRWQLRNVEYAEKNGYDGFMDFEKRTMKTGCEEELQWQPLGDYKEAMEKPFIVMWNEHFNSKTFLVPQNEPVWVTNIRRSLLHLFKNPIMEGTEDSKRNMFKKEPFNSQYEHSPQGECSTWYSLLPIMDAHKMELSNEILDKMVKDVQNCSTHEDITQCTKGSKGCKRGKGGKGSKGGPSKGGPPEKIILRDGCCIEDSMWRLTRTIDFDQCRDLTQYHTVGVPTTGSKDHEDCNNAESLQRSHNAEFIFRGNQTNCIRLERARVNGVYAVDAVGNEAEHLHTVTNQKLDLLSVSRHTTETEIDISEGEYVTVDLRYSLADPIQNIIGDKTEAQISIFKDYVMKTLKALAVGIETSHRLNVVDDLEMISQSQILRYLMKTEDFNDIYSKLKEDKSEAGKIADLLYFKVLAASGHYNPVMYLIQTLKLDDNYRNNNDVMIQNYLIMNFNAIEDTRLVSPIWNAIKEEEFAILPFSLLAKRLCMNPCNQENTRDANCLKDSCRSVILKEFLPAMLKELNDPNKDEPYKHRAIQALKNLHTAAILEPLRTIILGTSETNVLLRIHSIFALKGDNLPRAPKEEIFNLLNGVFENRHEHPQVREAALRMLPHWSPPAAWWYHIATTSWQEPNKQIAAVIYHIISTFASVYPAAYRATLITKPAPPRSLFYSNILFFKNGDKNNMIRSEFLWTLMSSNEALYPALSVLKFQGGFMNLNFNELQITTLNEAGGINWNVLYRAFGGGRLGAKDASADIVKEMYLEILENIGVESKEENPSDFLKSYVLLNLFKTEIMKSVPIPDFDYGSAHYGLIMLLFSTFASNSIRNSNTFMNTGRYTHTVFTEIGVPLNVQHSQPTFLSLSSTAGPPDYSSPNYKAENKKFSLLLEYLFFRIDRQESVKMHTAIPWLDNELISGLTARQEVTFPYDVLINTNEKCAVWADVTINLNKEEKLKPIRKGQQKGQQQQQQEELNNYEYQHDGQQSSLLGISNTPFTAVAPIMHSSSYQSLQQNYRILKIAGPGSGYMEDLDLLEYTGLALSSTFKGDIPSFFRKTSLNSLIASVFNGDCTAIIKPTARYYEWSFGINVPKTKVKALTFTFNYIKKKLEEDYNGGQQSQGEVDYSNYGQFDQQKNPVFDECSEEFGVEYEQISQDFVQDFDFGQDSAEVFSGGVELDRLTEGVEQGPEWVKKIKTIGIYQENFANLHENFKFQSAKHIQSLGFGVEFHESSTRRYEAIFSWANSKLDGSKFQIFLSKRPYEFEDAVTTCMNINSDYPTIPPFATLQDILNMEDYSAKIKTEVFQNPNCEPINPIISFEGVFNINETELTTRLDGPEACLPDKNDPTQLTIPSYRNARFTFSWNEVPPVIQELSNQAMDISQWGAFFPYITAYHTDVNNEKNKIVYNIQQQGDGYKVEGQYPEKKVILENLDIPLQLLTPGFSWSTVYNQIVSGRDSYPQCVLEENKLRTFDGVTFNHEFTNCWSVLVRDCLTDQGLILARNDGGELVARVLWNAAGIMVDMTRGVVMVNGEDVANDASTDLYQVKFSETEQSMIVQFTDYATVKISDRIIVSMPTTEKGRLCGICGDMDGEVIGELQGSQKCIYDDGELFVNSWSVPGDGCNAFGFRSKMKKVNDYREDCIKNINVETGNILKVGLGVEVPVTDSCYNYTYATRQEGDYICTTLQPVNYCQPGCTPLYKQNVPVPYECVSSSSSKQMLPGLPSFPNTDCSYYTEFLVALDRGCAIAT